MVLPEGPRGHFGRNRLERVGEGDEDLRALGLIVEGRERVEQVLQGFRVGHGGSRVAHDPIFPYFSMGRPTELPHSVQLPS